MAALLDFLAAWLARNLDRFARFAARVPVPVLLLNFAITALAGHAISQHGVRLDFTVDSLFATATDRVDDPKVVYDDFQSRFRTNDNALLVALQLDGLYSPRNLALVHDLTRALAGLPHVRQAYSIRNTIFPFARDETALLARDLTPAQCQRLRRLVEGNTFYVNTLVSRDERVASIILDVDPSGVRPDRWPDERAALVEAVRATLNHASREHMDAQRAAGVASSPPLEYHFSGIPVVENRYVELLWRDLETFTAISVGVIALILFLYFRSPAGVLLPLMTVVMTNVWVIGLMTHLGYSLTLTSTILPSLLIILCISDAVFLISEYQSEIRFGRSRRDAIVHITRDMGVACFLTSLTTAIGFSSLVVVQVRVVQEFAVFASLGVMFAYIITITFVPAALNVMGSTRLPMINVNELGFLDHVVIGIARVDRTAKKWVVLGAVAILGLSAVGVFGLRPLIDFPGVEVNSSWFQDIRASDPLYVDNKWIEDNLTGVFSMEVEIQGTRPDVIRAPETLARIGELQKMLLEVRVDGHEGPITKTFSLLDLQNEIQARQISSELIPKSLAPVDEVMQELAVLSASSRDEFRRLVERYQYEVFRLLLEQLDDGSRVYEHIDEMVELLNGGWTNAARAGAVAGHPIGRDPDTGLPLTVGEQLRRLYMETQVPFGALRTVVPVARWGDLLMRFRYLLNIDTGSFNQVRFLTDELLDRDLLRTLVTDDYTHTRVSVLMKDINSRQLTGIIRQVQEWNLANFDRMSIQEQKLCRRTPAFFTRDTTVRLTGKSLLGKEALDMVIQNMLSSLAWAMFLIFLVMCVLLRSFTFGLVAIIPNIVPLVVTLGAMGFLGIPLNFSTLMVFSIALGVAVNDTIHFCARFRIEIRVDGDYLWAVLRTLESTGRAMIFTGALLEIGFAILLFSNFQFTVNFGILGMVTMVAALLADLFLNPVLILLFRPKVK
ncbi:MAG: MMPL family transporter [Planctomycetes bacterium]|nr:MMPL family transporter [Planctomycetota bacterium]